MSADPFAPPSAPLDDLPPEPAQWPKVVGTISIVVASLAMVCNSCSALGPMMQSWAMSMVPPEKQEEVRQQQQQWAAFQPGAVEYVLMVLKVILAALLLAAGISLLGRKRIARTLHLVWAALVMVVIGTGLVLAILRWPEQSKALREASGQAGSSTVTFSIAIGCVTILLSLAWPIFCLIWFGLVKRDGRDLDGGGPEPAA